MYKSTTNFLRSAALVALFFVGLLSVNAAVTYHLDTHPVFDYSYTIEGTANIGAGENLLDNMPQAFWRASTTYKFYSDAAKTQEITTAPSGDCDVYVDYVFDPPFILSEEDGSNDVWHYFRGFSSTSTSWYGHLIYGILNTERRVTTGDTSFHFAFYGDGFNFHFKVRSRGDNNPWMYWNGNSNGAKVAPMARKDKGWQLYTNSASSSHFSSGTTIAYAHPDNPNLILELRNVSDDYVMTNIASGNDYYLNEKNELVSRIQTEQYERGLRWFGVFALPVSQNYQTVWHVTYKIMTFDDDNLIQQGADVVRQKNPNNLKPNLPNSYKEDGYEYYYYKDADLTQEWASDENMPNDQNTVVWVLKISSEDDILTTTTWKTLCLPVDLDPAAINMEVSEYTGVTTTKYDTKYSFTLHFTAANQVVEDMPYLYRFVDAKGHIIKLFNYWLNSGYYNKFISDNEVPTRVIQVSDSGENTEVQVVMTGAFENTQLNVQQDPSVDPLYFYFNYNTKAQAYKFYFVTKNAVTIKPFRCYFFAEDVPTGSSVSFGMDGATDGISQLFVTTEKSETINNGVYNLNGQLMNANGSTVGLPAGIYVVNGKKVVVK